MYYNLGRNETYEYRVRKTKYELNRKLKNEPNGLKHEHEHSLRCIVSCLLNQMFQSLVADANTWPVPERLEAAVELTKYQEKKSDQNKFLPV